VVAYSDAGGAFSGGKTCGMMVGSGAQFAIGEFIETTPGT